MRLPALAMAMALVMAMALSQQAEAAETVSGMGESGQAMHAHVGMLRQARSAFNHCDKGMHVARGDHTALPCTRARF